MYPNFVGFHFSPMQNSPCAPFVLAPSLLAYVTPGTYSLTIPGAATTAKIQCWGGGGGGGGFSGGGVGAGGGGGAEYSETTIAVTAGQVYSVVVGAGGLGQTTLTAATAGDDSYVQLSGVDQARAVGGGFGASTHTGGAGGTGGTAGLHDGGPGETVTTKGGGGGGGATTTAAGTAGASQVGGTFGGGNGDPGGGASTPGQQPGGGGGGGAGGSNGSNGGNGQILITIAY